MNSNSTLYKEKFRPLFHYTPEANWMNDPNGMVYFDGEYHLFYQYHPNSNVWGPMHWGHAVSHDMIHWEHLPIALYPDDLGYIFSGSAIVDEYDSSGFFNGESGLVVIFTHSGLDGSEEQVQSLAYSKDKGRSWIKYEGNPVLPNPGIKDFRDPKVIWHDGTKKWVMVLACGREVRFYSSENLKKWDFMSKFNDGSHAGVWECPDLFRLPVDGDDKNQKWVLKVDIGDGSPQGGSAGQYFVGEFDGIEFMNDNLPDKVLWVDYGRDFYASQSWSGIPEHDGRCLWLAWMSNWQYANKVPTSPWRSAMTIPRQVGLKSYDGEGIRLVQAPVADMHKIRKRILRLSEQERIKEKKEILNLNKKLIEIVTRFKQESAKEFGFKISTGDQKYVVIGYNTVDEKVFVDRSNSGDNSFSPDFAGRHEAKLEKEDDMVNIHIFLDISSVELFANDGKVVITNLIFPEEGASELEVYALGGSVEVLSMTIYELDSIWNEDTLNSDLKEGEQSA